MRDQPSVASRVGSGGCAEDSFSVSQILYVSVSSRKLPLKARLCTSGDAARMVGRSCFVCHYR